MAEGHVERIHTEPVVLDIGEETGGLIIYTSEAFRGREIEVSPLPDASTRVHTDVAERRFNGRTVFAAVYLPFPAGDYLIWGPNAPRPTAVTIMAGTVVELDWRHLLSAQS